VLSYYQCLAGLAVLFIALERVWPRVSGQRLLRRGWLSDAAYIVFNSKYVGILLGYVTALWLGHLNAIFARGWLASWPWWAQFVALLVSIDFVKWSIHNLLHRVPWLWEFHKVHHSIVELDWIGDWRFHWGEMLVYNGLLYAPTALLGASAEVALAVGVFDTLIGHFAHANLRWRIGWLKYVINSPQMHIWHHNHPDCGPANRNFGLTLSVWDWLFGTAHLPEHDPARLGFEGIERYPGELPGQWWAPFRALMERSAWRPFVVGIAGNLRRSFRVDRLKR
jgi:sterol desaturase/sphingolipid hydroxylase (fatty acid hydroxylase superfamily)